MLVFLIAGVLYSADRSQDFLFYETEETAERMTGESDTTPEAAGEAGGGVAAISGSGQEPVGMDGDTASRKKDGSGNGQKPEDGVVSGTGERSDTVVREAGAGQIGAGQMASGGGDADPAVTGQPLMLHVHVCGAVKQTGVYLLAQDAIVEDAIKAAGGVTEDGAGDYLNLADALFDGEKIYVPFLKDLEHPYGVDPVTGKADSPDGMGTGAAGGSNSGQSGIKSTGGSAGSVTGKQDAGDDGSSDFTGNPGRDGASDSAGASGKVNINTAGKEQLMTLPGIGETRGEAIISYREEHGGFSSIEDIMKVSGIKEGAFSKIKDSITV